ncbi:anaerobic ribonucleoside-triphosphate reductase [Halobacteroides halobius]|uniref:anaerobic ribonucleoside-triphosphate reductase n=1 Tax=Halobacteroides halobius TaxID=42422 RepID=UPI0005A0057C|nr:anaerobic ribonucleoside-triphosphate reductase [Halobacteroides halobius]
MSSNNEERTRCQTYSRVVGFITPTENWNKGKLEEFEDRVTYDQALETASE